MEIQKVTIPVGNEKMSGLLYVPTEVKEAKLPSIVIFHGWGSSKKRYIDRAQAFAEKGYLTLVFDFRGCGESDGSLKDQTVEMGFQDANAGFEFLRKHPLCDNNRMGVLGGSFGGYQAALIAGEKAVRSLILSAPAIYQDEWWGSVIETMDPGRRTLYWRQSEFTHTKAMQSIRKYPGKLLVIQHEKDEVIPARIPKEYFQNAIQCEKKEIKVIPNAPHALHDKVFVDQSIEIVVDWFTKTL